jgi:hypothetical protein
MKTSELEIEPPEPAVIGRKETKEEEGESPKFKEESC